MLCNNFWKGTVTLCLTFWLGVFVSGLFTSKQLLQTKSGNKKSIQMTCVPDDKSLNYYFLSEREIQVPVEKAEDKVEEIIVEPQKNKEPRAVTGKENSAGEIEKQLYKFSEDKFQNQNLLHKENCYEFKEQK